MSRRTVLRGAAIGAVALTAGAGLPTTGSVAWPEVTRAKPAGGLEGPLRWLAIGDSITEGTGVFQPSETWVHQCGIRIRDSHGGGPDPLGWAPVIPNSHTLELPWRVTGAYSTESTFGLRRSGTVRLTGQGATIAGTVTGTSIDIWHTTTRATRTFSVEVDGGEPIRAGRRHGSDHTRPSRVRRIDLGGGGRHRVVIRRGAGDCFIEGIAVFGHNERSGLQVYNAGRHGWTSGRWVEPTGWRYWGVAVERLDPHVVTIMLGANDFTTEAGPRRYTDNVHMLVRQVRLSCTTWPGILLISPYKRDARADPGWRRYEHALARLARRLDCDYLDLRDSMPDVGTRAGRRSGYYYDDVHPDASGSRKIAREVARALARVPVGRRG